MLIWTSRNIPNVGLFSAYAEVFPLILGESGTGKTFLCLRRGVSPLELYSLVYRIFSLPTQRCFSSSIIRFRLGGLFSAYAEVFLYKPTRFLEGLSFLCLRRGVSHAWYRPPKELYFSLPTQRCFPLPDHHNDRFRLFSAYAEVFPSLPPDALHDAAFLCLRRGVSGTVRLCRHSGHFSLPTQRCFFFQGV